MTPERAGLYEWWRRFYLPVPPAATVPADGRRRPERWARAVTEAHELPLEPVAPEPAPGEDGRDVTDTVPSLVSAVARARPDAVAVSEGGLDLRYTTLVARADRLAARLRVHGTASRVVVVRLPTGADQVVALLAALTAGAQVLWLGMSDPGTRGRELLARLGATVYLTAEDRTDDPLFEWARRSLGASIMTVDGGAVGEAGSEAAPGDATAPGPGHGDLAYVMSTSGSTGRPKAVLHTHAALSQFASWFAGTCRLRPGVRVAQWVAPEHDPALFEVFATLVAGATLHPVPDAVRRHPERLARWLSERDVDVLQTVPSMARELAAAWRRAAAPAPSLSCLVLMGEALTADLVANLVAAVPGLRVLNVYGPTETVAATWFDATTATSGRVPVGRAIPGRAVFCLDDAGRRCPAGVTGEIVVRSRYVSPGYVVAGPDGGPVTVPVGSPAGGGEESAARPVLEYRTGDLGRLRWDGLLEFRGRRDHQVKLNGVRIELGEVEAALDALPGVIESAVLPVARDDGPVRGLVAHVVVEQVPEPDVLPAWRAALRELFGAESLPLALRPRTDRLPRTVAGKVDRPRLAEAPSPSPTSPGVQFPPSSGSTATPDQQTAE